MTAGMRDIVHDDTPFWKAALQDFRRCTGDQRPAHELPLADLSRILLDAQRRKEASRA